MQYISILRGINVGGKRKILMADLKQRYINLGFKNPISYIQSGNIIFETDGSANETTLTEQIEKDINATFGFDVPVIVRTMEQLKKIIDENPFNRSQNIDIDRLHLTFLSEEPAIELLQRINSSDYKPDAFSINKNNAFVFCSGKYSDTKLNNQFFEKKLGISATTRNWKTVLKLYELAKG